MIWAVGSMVPIATGLFVALVLFAGWVALMVHWDRQAVAAATTVRDALPMLEPVRVVVPAPVVATARTPVTVPVVDTMADLDELLAPRSAPEPVVVRSGSFCTVVGATGVTAAGTEMVCTAIEGARPRWRRAAHELARSS